MDNTRQLIQSLVQKGCFGKDARFTKVIEDEETKSSDGFASTIRFFSVLIEKNGVIESVPILTKQQVKLKNVKEILKSDSQFNNEVLMYRDLIPELGGDVLHVFPKLYFGLSTRGQNPDDDILIFEDLRSSGYRPSNEKLALDYSHCSIALKALAQFHAKVYYFRCEDEKKFSSFTRKLLPTKFDHSNNDMRYWKMLSTSMRRGIQALSEEGIAVELLEKLGKLIETPKELVNKIIAPTEPFNLINHGDFCRNNMFFKYDEVGQPIDVKFIDLQNSAYSNVVSDISFFLYMHTTSESRKRYWDKLIHDYYTTFEESLPPSLPRPSFNVFLKYFSQRVFFGYVPVSFFIPAMLEIAKGEPPTLSNDLDNDPDFWMEDTLTRGGEEGTKLLRDVVHHMVEKGYISDLLEYMSADC